MTTVLIVDDEAPILRALQINLNARGYTVLTARDGASALRQAPRAPIDLIILDLGLPDMDGVAVLTALRALPGPRIPIIVLSARHASDEKVSALDAGADDYVTKPFGLDELLARMRSALRRADTGEDTCVSTETFTVDLGKKLVTREGRQVHLTPTEWGILELLVRNRDRLVSQQELLTRVWGPEYLKETQYLRVYMAQLRRKLEPDPGAPRHLHTEPGAGYRFTL